MLDNLPCSYAELLHDSLDKITLTVPQTGGFFVAYYIRIVGSTGQRSQLFQGIPQAIVAKASGRAYAWPEKLLGSK